MVTDSRVRVVMVVGALVVGGLIGVLLGFQLDDGAGGVTPKTQTPSIAGPGPTREVNGVPVGYARTETGAVSAATNFDLLSGRDDLLSLRSLTAAMQTFAAPSWKAEAADQAKNGYEYIVNTYGKDVDVSASVLRYHVAKFTPESAAVRLWTVSVASGSKRPTVEEVWAVVTLDLAWVDGDWRVDGMESAVGPAPVDLPSGQPKESATTLMEEFDEFNGAPVP